MKNIMLPNSSTIPVLINLFKDLRSRYGQEAVKHVRDLENLEKKIARHRNHLTFTHRCKDNGITPTSLKIRCPINTVRARNIIKKAQKELVRERIRVVSNKIDALGRRNTELRKKSSRNNCQRSQC